MFALREGRESVHYVIGGARHVVEDDAAEAVALHHLTRRVRLIADAQALDQRGVGALAYPEQHGHHEALRLVHGDDDRKLKLGISGAGDPHFGGSGVVAVAAA